MSSKVLIVEDEPLVALDLETTLQEAGFESTELATSLPEAMDQIESAVDVVVLDANLNGVSSAPIAERLRGRQIPFVVVSGYTKSQLAGWLGDAPLLSKPVVATSLVAAISAAIAYS